jgi:hypothetical protein
LFINKYLTHYEKYNSLYTIFCTFGETRTLTPLTESGPKPDVSAIPPRRYFVELREGFEPPYSVLQTGA